MYYPPLKRGIQGKYEDLQNGLIVKSPQSATNTHTAATNSAVLTTPHKTGNEMINYIINGILRNDKQLPETPKRNTFT
jgi:hypothetical protein